MAKESEKKWFEKYQALIGNILILFGLFWAIWEVKVNADYQKNYNTYKILNCYVDDAKTRQDLINYCGWKEYFKKGKSIPKSEFEKLYRKGNAEKKSKTIFCITKLYNYYASIEFAAEKKLFSVDLYSEMKKSIEKDYLVLKHFNEVRQQHFQDE